MNERNPLPDYDAIEKNALGHLHTARNELSEVRDWLRSDWNPASPPTDAQHAARGEAMRLVSEAKAMIDQAKNALERS